MLPRYQGHAGYWFVHDNKTTVVHVSWNKNSFSARSLKFQSNWEHQVKNPPPQQFNRNSCGFSAAWKCVCSLLLCSCNYNLFNYHLTRSLCVAFSLFLFDGETRQSKPKSVFFPTFRIIGKCEHHFNDNFMYENLWFNLLTFQSKPYFVKQPKEIVGYLMTACSVSVCVCVLSI